MSGRGGTWPHPAHTVATECEKRSDHMVVARVNGQVAA
jgi:hypothetical protein